MAGTVIRSIIKPPGTMVMTGREGDGFLTAIAVLIAQKATDKAFDDCDISPVVPPWLTKLDKKYENIAPGDLSDSDKRTAISQFASIVLNELRRTLNYPQEERKGEVTPINLNFWHDAISYLTATVDVFEVRSGARAVLGDGAISLGTVVLYGEMVWIATDDPFTSASNLPCGCPIINHKVRMVFLGHMMVTNTEVACYDHPDKPPFNVNMLIGVMASSVSGPARAATASRCIKCNNPLSPAAQFCESNCFCLTCGFMVEFATNNTSNICPNCSRAINDTYRERILNTRAYCSCNSTIDFKTEGLICEKSGHILCGKCCVWKDGMCKCSLCDGKSLFREDMGIPAAYYTCDFCGQRAEELLECGHMVHRPCFDQNKKKCKRCARTKQHEASQKK